MTSAPFGAHTTNLAAISAAICTGPDAHPDPGSAGSRVRFMRSATSSSPPSAPLSSAVIAALPPELMRTVAGLALVGALASAMGSALAVERERFPALSDARRDRLGLHPPRYWLRVLGPGRAGVLAFALDAAVRKAKG